MAYKRQNFVKGQKLTAAQMNHIEDGITEHDGLTEGSYNFGTGSYAGLMGYYIKVLDIEQRVIELSATQQVPVASGDYNTPAEVVPPYSVGDVISIVNGSHYDLCGSIIDIDENNRIWVKELFPFNSIAQISTLDYDDYTFAVPEKPHLGVVQVAKNAYAFGDGSSATGIASFVEGRDNLVAGNYGHAEGRQNVAAYAAHAEGRQNEARGTYSHVEGQHNKAIGIAAHAEGYSTEATGIYSHSEGSNTHATGSVSHAEGYGCNASGEASHAEGYGCSATSKGSHAEGNSCSASGLYSHAEGCITEATGSVAHSEGQYTKASGDFSHAEGRYSEARSFCAHAQGLGTIAEGGCANAAGMYNVYSPGAYSFEIGNGTSDTARSNAFTVNWRGNGAFAGAVTSTTGADYAEYFEWLDGNPDDEDRVGYVVALDGEKICKATPEDDVLGIVSGTAAVIGDTAEWEWQGKYLTDDFGRLITESVELFIEGINPETEETDKMSIGFRDVPKLNPNYDESQNYTNRENRPEWAAVGMFGKLYVRDDGTCTVNKYAKVGDNGVLTLSEDKTNMRVLSRTSDNVIRVLLN